MATAIRSTPRRAGGSRPPASAAPAAPAQRVPTRRSTHLLAGALLAAAGLAGYGAAPLAGHPALDLPVLAGGAGSGLVVAVNGARTKRRRQLEDRLLEALTPLLGVRHLDRRILRLSRWTNGWPGRPGRVRIRYAPGVLDGDPAWVGEITATLAGRLLAAYRVTRHDQRGCRLWLRLVTKADREQPPAPHSQVRAERAITELIGPTAKVTAVELDGPDGGELRSITVSHQAGAKLAAAGYRNRIERVISTMMPGRWRAVWDLEEDSVRFEIRPLLPSSVWLPSEVPDDVEDLLSKYREVNIPYAVDEDGRELTWYPARVPQVMLTGGTGTGKTSMAHALLGKLTQYGWPVWVLDAKRVEFLAFRDWPNVQIVAGSIPQQVALVRRVWELMEYRYQLIEDGQASVSDFEPLIVFLDEFAEFRSNLMEWYAQVKVKGDPTKPPTLAEVASLARKARTARIHLVLSTQRPDVEFLGGEALALDTPVPTPEGWTTMGDVEVGDHVFAEDGRPVRVTATTEVAQSRPCYRVTFSDGSSIVTDEQHLWVAQDAVQRAYDAGSRRTLSRAQRWPEHAALADALSAFDPHDAAEVTVAEFESKLGRGQISLLRRLINVGRRGPEPVNHRAGKAGRFAANVYRLGDLVTALATEVRSPAPTWRSSPRVVTTGEMAASLHYRGRKVNWSVQGAQPLDLPGVELPVDPWLLGYWLGDGHKASATVATADMEVLDRIRSLGYRVTHYARFNYGIATGGRGGAPRPTLKAALRDLGVLDNKHIPARYLRASVEQRMQLLAGLLDSDGTCNARTRGGVVSGQVSFTNADRRLIDGVMELVASLGFIPTVRTARKAGVEQTPSSVAYGSPRREVWIVAFKPDRQVFRIVRKRRVLAPCLDVRRRTTTRRRYVRAVEPVESVPVRCITVDSPGHLYLAGRAFIPTHNCRDNFGQRISMGRLSPQGAMMMWENPAVGVSLPRACTGRATATHEDGRPVEVQCYRFPDLRAPEGSEEHRLLEAIRPDHSRHPRLMIVPPEQRDAETGELREPTFRDYARAQWDLAENRPDLDPLAASRRWDGVDGRTLSSTLASLGIAAPSAHPSLRRDAPSSAHAGGFDAGGWDSVDADQFEVDEYAGYAPATTCPPRALMVGDLIEVEEGSGVWVVVEEAPEDDVVAPGMVAISWRGDGDESGSISLPDDLEVAVRRPEEDA